MMEDVKDTIIVDETATEEVAEVNESAELKKEVIADESAEAESTEVVEEVATEEVAKVTDSNEDTAPAADITNI